MMYHTFARWCFGALFLLLPYAGMSAEMIELTQTGCQFVEPEQVDHQYRPQSADDCQVVNAETGEKRLVQADALRLKAGDYVFRVSNRNVPYELGFWLRGQGFARLTLPSVSGGGIQTGEFRDYAISLQPGEYLYSCPLNPTPDYTLLVE